mmetsp:Transcript_13685/g.35174  ORF Transcript_13685/g.35174 Transcript_13685/m.35174 type:complete len:211 (+) Transcript_13685:30-662(+)
MSSSSNSWHSCVPKKTSRHAAMSSAVTRSCRYFRCSLSDACAMALETLRNEACALNSCASSPSSSQDLALSSSTGKPCAMNERARASWIACSISCGSVRMRVKITWPLKLLTPLQVSFTGWSPRRARISRPACLHASAASALRSLGMEVSSSELWRRLTGTTHLSNRASLSRNHCCIWCTLRRIMREYSRMATKCVGRARGAYSGREYRW